MKMVDFKAESSVKLKEKYIKNGNLSSWRSIYLLQMEEDRWV